MLRARILLLWMGVAASWPGWALPGEIDRTGPGKKMLKFGKLHTYVLLKSQNSRLQSLMLSRTMLSAAVNYGKIQRKYR